MRKAQSTIEYIVIIGALAAAVIIMGVYMKRGFHGQVRGLSDQMGDPYEPGKMIINNSETTAMTSTETSESTSSDGTLTSQNSDSTQTQSVTRQANEKVGALE